MRVDELHPALMRHRDAMVAVLDEVAAADLEDRDRGPVPLGEGCPQALQAAAGETVPCVEVAVEVLATVDGADDPLDRNGAHPQVGVTRDPEPLTRLVERDEP